MDIMVGDVIPAVGSVWEWNSWGSMGSVVGVEFVVRCGGAVGREIRGAVWGVWRLGIALCGVARRSKR